ASINVNYGKLRVQIHRFRKRTALKELWEPFSGVDKPKLSKREQKLLAAHNAVVEAHKTGVGEDEANKAWKDITTPEPQFDEQGPRNAALDVVQELEDQENLFGHIPMDVRPIIDRLKVAIRTGCNVREQPEEEFKLHEPPPTNWERGRRTGNGDSKSSKTEYEEKREKENRQWRLKHPDLRKPRKQSEALATIIPQAKEAA